MTHALYDVPEETSYMTTITYDCQEGYKRGVGNWTRTCLKNKQWTGIPPMCEGQCDIRTGVRACVRSCVRACVRACVPASERVSE